MRRIEGQVRGLQRLIEEKADCLDILLQVSAVTSAMKKTGTAIISAHMQECLEKSSQDNGRSLKEIERALSRFIDLA